ncbi:hypothetical protein [Alkalicoccus daliensis]|uniref:Uncharacterized protein n=1 Tax=Alkalicoccus daliensis TaxID=745820 RepID=A0A1H0FZ43_9BACI|nr:hypothetical protein [Alkalicoccus daliensis]SDN99913.1 hypothetical protein SAMN04488053_105162 [Alkalicoccus daliensis]
MSLAFGYYSKAADPESFFKTTAGIIKRKVSSRNYRVDAGQSFLTGHFYITVEDEAAKYRLILSKEKSAELQDKSQDSLEIFLWSEFEKQGLPSYKFQ